MIRNLSGKLGALTADKNLIPPRAASVVTERVARFPLDSAIGDTRLSGVRSLSAGAVRVLANAPCLWSPEDCVFFDTETTGLSGGVGTVAFLVGAGWFEADAFVVAQWLMTDYDCEPELLKKTLDRLSRAPVWVSFNGRAFDAPLLQSRMRMHRMELPLENRVHIDLLHPARRIWRTRLQSCSLRSLEQAVLGVMREDDIPGAEIPARFFAYLQHREIAMLEDVMTHNRQDIVSLAALFVRMAGAVDSPESGDDRDALGLGFLNERAGRVDRAERCYRLVKNPRALALSRMSLAALYRRVGRYEDAARVLADTVERQPWLIHARIRLAILNERYLRDPAAALSAAQSALTWCKMSGYADVALVEGLERRCARLKARQDFAPKSAK